MKRFWATGSLTLSFLILATAQTFAATTGTLLPATTGNYQQWTPKSGSNHVTMVDESSCNGTTDYNQETTLIQRDSYGLSLASVPDGATITQINITPCASRHQTGTGSSTLDIFYRLNGVDSAAAGAYALPTGVTPVVLSTTSFSSLAITKSQSTVIEVGTVYSAGTRGVRVSHLATTITYTPLATPSSLTAAATGSALSLSWVDNATNEAGFKIERSDNGGVFVEIATVSANVTTYGESLSTGTYAYRVRAYNSGGNTGYTATATAYVLSAPSGLTAVATGSAATLNWTDNASNEDGFKIERSENGGSFAQIATVSANVTTYLDPSLSAGTYTYKVRAYKSTNSNSTYSNTDTAIIP